MLDYYVVLRSLLRDKPPVRPLLARCRHCGIFFIADPRNAGREDLGCPFGCADVHRSRRSTERSVAYNRSPIGKLKRRQRREERIAAKRSAAAGAHAAETQDAVTTGAAAVKDGGRFPVSFFAYIQVVISLLEGRRVHRDEILEMLARTRRQHSFAREKRIDYVLRRLRQEAEKPP